MGTTESILYDDDEVYEEEETVVVPSRGSSHRSTTRHQQEAPRRTTSVLNGCVLGMSKSGKTSLLDRFQGREPGRKSSGDRHSNDGDDDEERIEIPYKAPARTWHDRIRLKVQAGKKLTGEGTFDFYILLVDPRKPPDKVQKYLTKTIKSAVKKRQRNNGPLCLCLLRSFRDVLRTDDTKQQLYIESTDLTSWTLECLGQCLPQHHQQTLVLQQFDVSMISCYGLAQLHQFIYQAYVQYHMERLKVQLDEARELQRTIVQPQVSYEEFCQEVGESPPPSHQRRNIIVATTPEPREEDTAKSNDALEAFLESSDEEEEEEENPADARQMSRDTDSNERHESVEQQQDEDGAESCDEEDPLHGGLDTDEDDEPLNDEPPDDSPPRHDPQTTEQPSKQEGPPAAGEPTEDTSKPAIQESFFADDEESLGNDAVPSQATKDAGNVEREEEDDDDDDEFFISHIDHAAHDDTSDKVGEELTTAQNHNSEPTSKSETDTPKAYNPEIKAAIEAAKQDFERMLKGENDSEPKKIAKAKKKKDPEKKKRRDPDKKKKKSGSGD